MKIGKIKYILFVFLLCISNTGAQDFRVSNYCFSGNSVNNSLSSNVAINASIGSAVFGVIQSQNKIIRVNSSTRYHIKSNVPTITDIKKRIPLQYNLEQNYPNPFNPTTNIKYSVPTEGFVVLSIFNILGERLNVLVNENKVPGSYEVTWDASNYASGVYICLLSSGSYSSTKKLLLLK